MAVGIVVLDDRQPDLLQIVLAAHAVRGDVALRIFFIVSVRRSGLVVERSGHDQRFLSPLLAVAGGCCARDAHEKRQDQGHLQLRQEHGVQRSFGKCQNLREIAAWTPDVIFNLRDANIHESRRPALALMPQP